MPQPPQYLRITDFSTDEANNLTGRSTVRTPNLDTEFDNVKLTLDQLLTNIGLIQRDDGKLLDGIVTQASLSSTVTALFVAIGANPRGAWLTGTLYAAKDIIETGAPVAPYMCVIPHTSGVFATDYAAGRWVVLGAGLPNASQVSSTPTGSVAATNVQSAIAEIDGEKVAKALNGSDFANIATVRDNLSVFSRADVQTSSYVVATAAGTFDAITASFTPAITTLTNHQILHVRAIGANTVTNPTFTPNSGVVTAKTIKKLNNIALGVGDIKGSSHVMILQYNSTIDAWFLLNPTINITVSTFMETLLDDADVSIAQTTLGISTFIKTLIDDADATTARATLGITSTWTSAQQIGSGLTIGTVGNPAIAALNGTDVAFIDSTNDSLRTYRSNGSVFAQIGISLAIATVGNPAIAALNGTDIAFIDDSNDSLRTYRFDGTNWAQVGSSLAITTVGVPALAALNSTDIAFIDNINASLRTYRFNGSTWAQVGSGLSVSSATSALTALNATDVAFIDSTIEQLTTYRFNGTTWAVVGNGLSIATAGNPALAGLNGTDVAFIDGTNRSMRIYRFSGTNWAQSGSGLTIINTDFPALAALNGTDVAFIDINNASLRTYRFGQFSGAGPYKPA